MLIIKNIIINTRCPLCIKRYKKYINYMKKFNIKYKKENIINKLIILINTKKYINFYIDYLKCFKTFFPKKYKKYIKDIKKYVKKLNKKNILYNFYFKIIKIIKKN